MHEIPHKPRLISKMNSKPINFFILLSLFFFSFLLPPIPAELEQENDTQNNNSTKSLPHFLDLSPEQKVVLDEFRSLVVAPSLPHNYMSEDEYLIRFLRQTHFNVTTSQHLLNSMLSWRKSQNIDNLVNEDFPDFEQEYATFLEGCDRENRPVISVPLGLWDIREAALSGQAPQLKRFIDKIFEDGTSFLRAVNKIGLKLYQATLVIDLDGFDMKTHACPKCIEIYLYFFTSLSTHYPGFVEKIYFINTPQIATLIFDVYKTVFTPSLRAMTTIFGRDQPQLRKNLKEIIPKSSLLTKFGGDKESRLDFSYIRTGQQLISSLHEVGAVRLTNNCEKDLIMYETLIREMGVVFDKMMVSRGRRGVNNNYDECDE